MKNKITLATLSNYSEQEVFDYVANHLLNQRTPAIVDGTCRYRGNAGLSCAAGCLIDDSEYNQDFEGLQWHELVEARVVPNAHKELIEKLQFVHDYEGEEDWREGLKNVADKRKLLVNF